MSGLLSFLKSRGLSPVTTSFNKKRSKHETLVSFLNNFILNIYTTFILISTIRAGEKAHQLRTLAALPEDRGLILGIQKAFYNHL